MPPEQACAVCGSPRAFYGYGFATSFRPTLWACRAHRGEVEAKAVALGTVRRDA